MNPVLAEVFRGGHVESLHRGALAVADASGSLVLALGDVDRPVFPRSAVKPLQALALVASGAADALDLNDAELALACASHGGEDIHVGTAAGMLAKAGVGVAMLECGVHWPSHEGAARTLAARGEAPSALHNNCSGKHAGFLCVARMMARGAALPTFAHGYVRRNHPVMQEITAALAAATGFDPGSAPCAIDGCSIPTFGIGLRRIACGFARFGCGRALSAAHAAAARRLLAAMAAAPEMIAGAGRFDTIVAKRLGPRAVCKGGAEGVHAAAFPELGLGVAIKIDDGHGRAAEAAMAAVLEAAIARAAGEAAFAQALRDKPLLNWNGIEVGRVAAPAQLCEVLKKAFR